jgi:hypothetical protein
MPPPAGIVILIGMLIVIPCVFSLMNSFARIELFIENRKLQFV